MTAPLSATTTSATATSTNADDCPYCRTSDEIRRVTGTSSVQAWACDRCDTGWAFTTVPDTRAERAADRAGHFKICGPGSRKNRAVLGYSGLWMVSRLRP